MNFILIGNKVDLKAQYAPLTRRQVTFEEASSFANHYHMEHYETSALEDLNVKLIFNKASLQTMERIKNNTISINKDVASA